MCRKLLITASIVLGIGLLGGCAAKPVVGVLLPTTGSASTYGESIESGIRVALTEAREKNTLPEGFAVVWGDSQSDTEVAGREFRAMVKDKGVKMVIGGATSDVARALLPVLDATDTICLSPSASAPDLAKKSKLFYRIYPSDELEGSRAGQFIYDTLNAPTVLMYAGDTGYVRGIEPEFRQQYETNLGGKVVGRVSLSDADWRQKSVDVLLGSEPEAVYVVGYANDILEVLKHLRKQSYKGKIVTTSAFYSGKVLQEAGALAEGVFFPLPPFDRTSDAPVVKNFVERYMDTYQRAPDIFAAHGYDAMRLVIEVMKLAKPPETPEIKKALHFGITEFEGVTGPIMFDDYGDVKHYPKMFIVKDGQVVSYERFLKGERDRILREVRGLLGRRPSASQ